ncbi:MAG: hypothetical protein IKE22_04500 [Atopobiaceae bacterium]|nr:hypothetical protein [Atopobiaceae bacterium]
MAESGLNGFEVDASADELCRLCVAKIVCLEVGLPLIPDIIAERDNDVHIATDAERWENKQAPLQTDTRRKSVAATDGK